MAPVPWHDRRELAEAARVLRPDGRLLVLLDYGRDEVSRLRGDLPEYGLLSRRDGPLLRGGFKIRVVHCFWTFGSIDDGDDVPRRLVRRRGPRRRRPAMKRPRLTYNVAIYHRTLGVAA